MKVSLWNIDWEVEFDYQPAEPMVMYYSDGSGYPGCAEEVNIYLVTHAGDDFTEFFDRFGYTELEDAVLNELSAMAGDR